MEAGVAQSALRPLRTIAADIKAAWPKPNYGAVPYLDAMFSLNAITDDYYADSGESVVLYFLANANSFRGEKARALKQELKRHLGRK